MYYVLLDCGTTNSRAYVTSADGRVLSSAKVALGVRNVAASGDKESLRRGLEALIAEAVDWSGVGKGQISAVFSAGMITSELGLAELPHLLAPCGVQELADAMVRVEHTGLLPGVPVYFIRGIKNRIGDDETFLRHRLGEADFMRGEEVQMVGLIARKRIREPIVAVVLSSHSKFILIDQNGVIQKSLTTLSGQLFHAIKSETFVGKSIADDGTEVRPMDYFNKHIVRDAMACVEEAGLSRSLMLVRFMDVLEQTKWYDRLLFFESLVAAEDMQCVRQLKQMFGTVPRTFWLIGTPERCQLYAFILQELDPELEIASVTDSNEIDQLSIQGILTIAAQAGQLQGQT